MGVAATPAIHFLRQHNVPFTEHPYRYEERGGTAVSSRELGVDASVGEEPFVSDGTSAGTRRLADVAAQGGSSPALFTALGSLLLFRAQTNETGSELFALPLAALTDGDLDGLLDADERALGTGVLDPDSDDDGLADGAEVHVHGTDPLDADSDGDGFGDGVEIAAGTDPLDASSFPPSVPAIGLWGYGALAAALAMASRSAARSGRWCRASRRPRAATRSSRACRPARAGSRPRRRA